MTDNKKPIAVNVKTTLFTKIEWKCPLCGKLNIETDDASDGTGNSIERFENNIWLENANCSKCNYHIIESDLIDDWCFDDRERKIGIIDSNYDDLSEEEKNGK